MAISKTARAKSLWVLGICAAVGATGIYGWLVLKNTVKNVDDTPATAKTSLTQSVTPKAVEPVIAPPSPLPAKPIFDQTTLQTTIDGWNTGTPGTKAVAVMSIDGKMLASLSPQQPFFAASLYKFYTAYFGYAEVDAGRVSSSEDYNNGRTRSECLDVMVSESDSPCAEQMVNEIGKAEINNRLKQIGINNTSIGDITTTAEDAALMMARIARGEGLTPASQATFLQSAKNQIFRDALNAGFSDSVIVYDKVGFNELVEYHDVALVELADGRKFIVAVLTENAGTRSIAELARQLEKIVQQ